MNLLNIFKSHIKFTATERVYSRSIGLSKKARIIEDAKKGNQDGYRSPRPIRSPSRDSNFSGVSSV